MTVILSRHVRFASDVFLQSLPLLQFFKIVVLKNFIRSTGKHLWWSLFCKKAAGWMQFIKKETLAQVFSCEFCRISKNTFFYRTPPKNCFSTAIVPVAYPEVNLGIP